MKKRFLFLIATLLLSCSVVFARTNSTVKLSDDVYDLLEDAEAQGLCTALYTIKPYTQKYIVSKLEEIAGNLIKNKTSTSETELKVVRRYIERFAKNESSWKDLKFVISNDKDNLPINFSVFYSIQGMMSGGIYTDTKFNSYGFEEWNNLGFSGDFGNNVSFDWDGGIEFTKMPLTRLNESDYEYYIGNWWNENPNRTDRDDFVDGKPQGKNYERFINTYKNYAVLPYSYFKKWDGSVYHLSNFDASGLEGWPTALSFGLNMQAALEASFFNNRLYLGISRKNREWGAMDHGAGLALNANARPFLGIEANFKLFDWLSFGALTGFLEFPHQEYINYHAWFIPRTDCKYYDQNGNPIQLYDATGKFIKPAVGTEVYDDYGFMIIDKDGNQVRNPDPRNQHTRVIPGVYDSYFFQSMFGINIMNFDFKYFHFDFGSTVIFPKRIELGYMFPIIEKVIYQNNLGDFDNLGLFGSFEGRLPGLGSVWASVFIDEINAKNIKTMFNDARCMFAYQVGLKSVFPLLPFGKLSFRYTKIEPYCYTHIAVKTPHNTQYTSTAYMNNGSSLGYYLDPNSDEFLLRIDGSPVRNLNIGFQYQLIRHGTTWGSGAVEGSSIYSELSPNGRNDAHKYFLKDGVYEWSNIVALDASYDFRGHNLPMRFDFSAGFIYDWFTSSGSYNNPKPMNYINTAEYPTTTGVVLSMGFSFFTF